MPIFRVDALDGTSAARTGTLDLPHGPVQTPAFMPVGTAGTVKAIDHDTLHRLGYRLILGNTYHLFLRPGSDVLASFGGLHAFSSWEHNILTDSGGYQVMSLADLRTIDDDGVTFQSHIDGSRHTFTPESVVDTQVTIGSDIQMALDELTPHGVSHEQARVAMERTHRWASRAWDRWQLRRAEGYRGHLFPIVQGNFFADLRRQSAETIAAINPPGIAIGGLAVGEPYQQYHDTLLHTAALIPDDRPRYVMGIGTPDYIVAAVGAGIDLFDCVFPTRAGRTATIFTTRGRVNLRNARFAHDDDDPDPGLDSFGGRRYSVGYLRHLFKAGEMLGPILATRHNLRFMAWLVENCRTAIREHRFAAFARSILEIYPPGGEPQEASP